MGKRSFIPVALVGIARTGLVAAGVWMFATAGLHAQEPGEAPPSDASRFELVECYAYTSFLRSTIAKLRDDEIEISEYLVRKLDDLERMILLQAVIDGHLVDLEQAWKFDNDAMMLRKEIATELHKEYKESNIANVMDGYFLRVNECAER